MSLSKDLAVPPVARPGPQCSIQKLLESLPTTDAEAVETALANPAWEATRLAETLTRHGHRISDSTIRRHRRGLCLCAHRDEKETT